MSASPTSIRWSLVNYGYAHELAIPWTIATRTHWSEVPADRILEESLFWVQTRAIECNYCMGHCEMLLEVAGLDKAQIARRTRLLAETDWSKFPPEEQRAYEYARKLSLAPWELTANDYQSLTKDYGQHQGMSIFWWLCRGLYMTRISDGFQLPLEKDNVFSTHAPTERSKVINGHDRRISLALQHLPRLEPTTMKFTLRSFLHLLVVTLVMQIVADEQTTHAQSEQGDSSKTIQAVADEPLSGRSAVNCAKFARNVPADSEAIAMLNDIIKGSHLSADDGWFPLAKSQSRYDWNYVCKTFDKDSDGIVDADEIKMSQDAFGRLDRNGDRQITELDFDWSEHSLTPKPGLMLFFMADADANGKVTPDEFQKLFSMFGGDETGYLAIDDVREQLLPPTPGARDQRPDRPSKSTLVKGLESQEIGSLQAGPNVGDTAPDFTLSTLQSEPVTLSKRNRRKTDCIDLWQLYLRTIS